jgi:hypothetical protein
MTTTGGGEGRVLKFPFSVLVASTLYSTQGEKKVIMQGEYINGHDMDDALSPACCKSITKYAKKKYKPSKIL